MPNVEKMLEDFIKGARSGEGFIRGGQVGIQLDRLGTEVKLAGAATATLQQAYTDGFKAACDQFKIAVWGQLAALGARALPAIGRAAGTVAKSPFARDMAVQTGAGLAQGAIQNRLQRPSQPPM